MTIHKHIGSALNDLPGQDGLLAGAKFLAFRRVTAYELAHEMERAGLTEAWLAARMDISRAEVDRLLDPDNFPSPSRCWSGQRACWGRDCGWRWCEHRGQR